MFAMWLRNWSITLCRLGFGLVFFSLLSHCAENSNVVRTYENIIPCARISMEPRHHGELRNWKFPEDAESHYIDLLEKTKIFRDIPIHSAGDYNGPWIENYFISKFLSKKLDYFNGFIPLFIQWVDIHVYSLDFENKSERNNSIPHHRDMPKLLKSMLRKDVLYLAVSQDDDGIGVELRNEFPNLFVLSAGGFGQVAIPLVKGNLKYSPAPAQYNTLCGFYGNIRPRLSRSRLLMDIERSFRSHGVPTQLHGVHGEWIQAMQSTLFNLAPRGYGRTSYRLAEIVQIGRIPIYIFDDFEWLPYQNTNISLTSLNYGFSVNGFNPSAVSSLAKRIAKIKGDENEIRRMLENIKNVRKFYTYDGVVEQIELFIRDPLGPNGGYLRCSSLPPHAKSH